MKLSDFSLSARIIAAAMTTVIAGATLLLFAANARDRSTYLGLQNADLKKSLHAEEVRLKQTINAMRQDVLFLSGTPPITGIVRASQKLGYDTRYRITKKVWAERLQQIFATYLKTHSIYKQVHFNWMDEGVPGDSNATPDFREGQVNLSKFTLHREWDAKELPYLLSAATPVYTSRGEIFGIVTLSIDASNLLQPSVLSFPPNIQTYIADSDGQYLLHPDSGQALAPGTRNDITQDFPGLKKMLNLQAPNYLPLQKMETGASQQYLTAERIYFDPGNQSRFLLLAYGMKESAFEQLMPMIPLSYIVNGMIIMLLIGVAALQALKKTFAPLKSISAVADIIAAGEPYIHLPQAGGGEIGSLSRAIDTMLFKLTQREKDILLINAGLEERVRVRTVELELAQTETGAMLRRYRTLMLTSMDGIHIMDTKGNLMEANVAFCSMLGYSLEEVQGLNLADWETECQVDELLKKFNSLIGNCHLFESLHRRKDGVLINVETSINGAEVEGLGLLFASSRDITSRKKAEEEIHNLAFYDALTKLPNRRLFLDRFCTAVTVSARHNNFGAVLFIDLDRFKQLNDTLGHDYGDLMLIEVAVRIKNCIREVDTASRFGGDEFVVLIEDIGINQDDASYRIELIAEKIRSSLADPYNLSGLEHHSSPSIGVCLYRGNEVTVDELLQHADLAMYQAKNSGRNTVRFFDTVMQHNVEMRAELLNDLHHAIARSQLHLHYQIQMDNANRPVGAEALLRWIHPERGIVMPEQLFPIAHESALILEIGDWVMHAACRQLALWSQEEKTRDLVLTVNICTKQFNMPDFVDRVACALQMHQINPALLKLEFSESMVLEDQAGTVEKMLTLKTLGVRLSMDGFGTRYSSLSNLKQLPLDQLKLGRSFVHDIACNGGIAMLVQSIIDLSNKFSIDVIAEGVENEAQLALLKGHKCAAYQGYLFGKATSIEEFEHLLICG